jgi:hypothetical protein
MGSLILNNPVIEMVSGDAMGGTPGATPVDVSCHVNRVEITVEIDEKDASTFCNPGGTEPGPPVYTADIDWKLQTTPDPTHEVLAPLVGLPVFVTMVADDGTSTEQLELWINFGPVNPGVIGAWEAGEVVEAATSHTATEPSWSPVV